MSRRVALYFRVSTADQTPAAQIRELRLYAEQRGFEVVAEFVDTASGAARSRPELDGPGLGVDLDRDALDHYRCADPCLA